MENVTRKDLLKNISVLVIAIAGFWFFRRIPEKVFGSENNVLNSKRKNKKQISKKILIAYTTMHGSTKEVAENIAGYFKKQKIDAEVLPAESVKNLNNYTGVIIGSPIKSEKWMPDAEKFVSVYKIALSKIPTAYFLTCLTLASPEKEAGSLASKFLDPVKKSYPEVKPVAEGLFAGVLDYSKYSTAVKIVMKCKMWANGIKEGDYRDWKKIKDFSKEVKIKFITEGVISA